MPSQRAMAFVFFGAGSIMNSTVVVYLFTCHEEKVFGVTNPKRLRGKIIVQ